MAVIIDDALLIDVLADAASEELSALAANGEVFTTGCWYYRLARAIATPDFQGALSRRVEQLGSEGAANVRTALDALPPEIGLLSLRELVPVMRSLRTSVRVNMLNAEALAAAAILDAQLLVSVDAPLLRTAAAQLGIHCAVSAP